MNNKPIINNLRIEGFMGYKTLSIPFSSNTIIFMGENGTGKTTLLNIIHAILTKDYEKLKKYPFSSIQICCDNFPEFSIDRNEIPDVSSDIKISFSINSEEKRLNQYKKELSTGEDNSTLTPIEINTSDRFAFSNNIKESVIDSLHDIDANISEEFKNHYSEILKKVFLDMYSKTPLAYSSIEKFSFIISSITENMDILHFPTYRRIEEKIMPSEQDSPSKDISAHFGMDDVANRFKTVSKKIIDLSFKGFSRVNGEVLTEFARGIDCGEDVYKELRTKKTALSLVLKRIGTNLTDSTKKQIAELLKNNTLEAPQYKALAFFLSKLLTIYDEQKELDSSVQSFVKTCNYYLYDKKLDYDVHTLEIGIKSKRGNHSIDLNTLSSGEKQIISLFSKIYLDSPENFILLIDEPELSLSLDWQKRLLPDILSSGKCKMLIATTHSPFIFDNELDQYATDLGLYFSNSRGNK